ncbi:hypothetical protein ACOSP7_017143 [Xanthoceras sorbifolium]
MEKLLSPVFFVLFFNIFSSKPYPVFASTLEANALLKWKASFANQTHPCTWFGMFCNTAGSVIKMNFTSFGLIGTLDELSFSSFPNVKYIDLAINSLSGTIPSQIACLSKLEYLDLSTNQFSGEIPPEIGLLTNLQVLHLVQNQLNGSIPHEIDSLRSLSELSLYKNHIHGLIPASLSNLNNLAYLYLYNNSLSGSIPLELGNLENLVQLDIDTNKLTGPIPSTFGNLNKLIQFYAFHNNLSGPIPHEIGNLKSLVNLSLHSNNLSGSIPSSFGGLGNLTCLLRKLDIELGKNQLTGEIPISFHNLINLEYLTLNHNKLTSSIPQEIENFSHNFLTSTEQIPWKKLQFLNLRSNLLQGPLPVPPPTLEYLLVSNNQLIGEIPHSICNVSTLQVLNLSHNNLSGINRFHGTIPGSFVKGNQLRTLNFNSNGFEGPVPRSLVHCRMLEVLDIGNNKLTDTFPYWLGTLPKLQVLVLRSNKFFGFVKDSEANNSFSECHIPSSLGNLTALESLDLSSNRLVGEIPRQLASLNFLEVLNLSQNQLSGPIPRGTQLDTFENDSYSDNLGLCGFPLSNDCHRDETPQPSRIPEDDTESEFAFGWIVVLMGYESGTVLGMTMGYLVFSTGKPWWLVRIVERENSRIVIRHNNRRRGRRN